MFLSQELTRSILCGSFIRRGPAFRVPGTPDTDRESSASFDRQASATNSVSILGLFPPKVHKTVSFFVSFHRGAKRS